MSDRVTPPTWTEWTRNPNERSPQRRAFDEIFGDLRKEGLIEVRGSLFVQLARYSYLQVKNALIEAKAFVASIPDSVFHSVSPAHRRGEVEAVLRILAEAGLAQIQSEGPAGIEVVLLTERQAASVVAQGQELQALLNHLHRVFERWDPAALVNRVSLFPTPAGCAKATGIDRAHVTEGLGCAVLQDRPEDNESNPEPFLQATIDKAAAPLVLLRFWPLPDNKGPQGGGDPEFTLLIPGTLGLETLVRQYCVPLFAEFFRSNDHHDAALEIQAKYANYMHKYRERFPTAAGASPNDLIAKVLASFDLEGEIFANAVYVVAQVLKAVPKDAVSANRRPGQGLIYQAARICYAYTMALRVRKRRLEKEEASRNLDTSLLVNRLKESPRPLNLEELRKTPDATKKTELGLKYSSLVEFLPLTPLREGERPLVYEVKGAYLHRENLIRTFLELREREAFAQRERLSREWSVNGVPPVGEVVIPDREVAVEFLKVLDLLYQERVLAASLPDFLKDFVPGNGMALEALLWPDGGRVARTPLEMVARGLDPILFEDKDRLRRRTLAGVLGLADGHARLAKAAWNLVLVEQGFLRFVIRKLAALFGGSSKPQARKKKAGAAKVGAPAKGPDPRAARAAELQRLVDLAPLLKDREALAREREKAASQWCLKLDPEANRQTRRIVDDEIHRLAPKIDVEKLHDANAPKVALFLVERSAILESVTSSRAFHRYLYLTALQRRADLLSR